MYIPRALLAGEPAHCGEEFAEAAEALFEGLGRHDPDLSGLLIRVCGGPVPAAAWLTRGCEALCGRMPLQLLLRGERALVVYALAEMEQAGAANGRDTQRVG